MKFEYKFERKDFENYLKESNRKYNYICLGLFTILYFGACLDLLSANPSMILISYLISIVLLFSILKLTTVIFIKLLVKRNDRVLELSYGTYKIEIAKDKIIEDIEGKHYEVAYKDIYRITKKDKWFIIYPKNEKIMFLFIKKLFDKEVNYEKCVNLILQNYQKSGKEVEKKEVKKEPVKKKTPKKEKKK